MRKIKIGLLFLLIFAVSSIGFSQDGKGVKNLVVSKLPAKEKRFALIIGVDTYQKDISPLYGTVNDAKALRDVLIKSAGFSDENIILMTTDSGDADLIPTRGNIIDQLDKLQRVVPADGLILFSFSGHGVSIGNDAFIVPSDGRIYQNADLMRERAIDVVRIREAIQATKVKQVIMFLDACRNDPSSAKGGGDNDLTPAYTKGFSFDTKNQNIEAYATLYATSFGDRAYEFLDKRTNKYRGYFSYAIEEGLKGSAANAKGEVTLAGLIRYIEETVKERVRVNENQKQIPYPTTEGFRNSDLVIAVVERNAPVTTNSNSAATSEQEKQAEKFYNLGLKCPDENYDCQIFNYSKAINLSSKFENAYARRGLSYYSKEEYESAIRDFNKAIELDSEYTGAYVGRGRSYVQKQEYDAALRDYNKAIELDSNFGIAYKLRGNLYYDNKKDYNAAIRDYTKFIELNPSDAIVYKFRGDSYKKQQEYDLAIRDYTKAIELSADFVDAYVSRGYIYSDKKDYNSAIRDFTKVINLTPNDSDAYAGRAALYTLNKSYNAAIIDLTRAIELNPKEPNSYFFRAKLYYEIGEKVKAEADLRKYEEIGGGRY